MTSATKLSEGILSTGFFNVVDTTQEKIQSIQCKIWQKTDESIAQIKAGKCKVIKTVDL